MPQSTCHHVLANGALCQAAPLRHRDYCRFHLQHIGRRMKAARMRARQQPVVLKLPLLEDLYSVQVALIQLADAIAYQEIDPQRARLLTTVLRLAMQNLKSKQGWENSSRFQLAESEATPTAWDSFEQEYDLPTGLDLSLDPEVAFPPPHDDAGVSLNPGAGVHGDDWLRAQVRRALGDAESSPPLVTADHVELMEIYKNEGDKAATKFADKMVRNDRRRERYMQRARYEELARQHSIKLAASRLVEEQRQAEAAAARAQATAEQATAEQATAEQATAEQATAEQATAAQATTAQATSEDASETLPQHQAEANRKPPQGQAATANREAAAEA